MSLTEQLAGGPRLPYRWIVVGVAFISMAMAYSVWYSFSVFLLAISQDTGWSRSETAVAYSVNVLVYGLCAPLTGVLLDRLGPRLVLPIGAALVAAAFGGSSQMHAPWEFYLFYGVFGGLGMILSGSLPNFTVIQQWFPERRGTALGFASAGIGFGSLVFVPLAQYLISTAGWRIAYGVLALLAFLVVVPATAFLHWRLPKPRESRPAGSRDASSTAREPRTDSEGLVVDPEWAARDWTVRRALSTRRFWFVWLAFTLTPLGMQNIVVHQAAFLADHGYEVLAVAVAIGFAGVAGSGFRILWGYGSDRLGREQTMTLGAICSIAGVGSLQLSGATVNWTFVWLFVFLFGIGSIAGSPIYPAMLGDIFQGRYLGSILGICYVGIGLGSAVGPLVAGYIFDRLGSYYLAFSLAMTVTALAALMCWLAAPRRVRLVPGRARRRPVVSSQVW